MKEETKRPRRKKKHSAEPEPSRFMMGLAAEREAEIIERRHRRKRNRVIGWSIAVPVLGAIAALLVFGGINAALHADAERAAISNTRIEFRSEPDQVLLGRLDGSFYSLSDDAYGVRRYTYSTTDQGGSVDARIVSTQMERGGIHWDLHQASVDVNVKVIPEGETLSPRVTFEKCTLKPIDTSKPSYEGDPYAQSFTELGTGKTLEGAAKQLCEDRITLWVPDGTLQPE